MLEQERADLLRDIPRARAADLAARKAGGNLTALEALAFAVLRGGREGEEAVGPFIDAAQEEYNHGTYRVPVRVVGDRGRVVITITPSPNCELSEQELFHVQQQFAAWRDSGKTSALLIAPAGARVDAIEIPEGATPELQLENPGNG